MDVEHHTPHTPCTPLTSIAAFDGYIIGMALVALGGPATLVSTHHLSNLFPVSKTHISFTHHTHTYTHIIYTFHTHIYTHHTHTSLSYIPCTHPSPLTNTTYTQASSTHGHPYPSSFYRRVCTQICAPIISLMAMHVRNRSCDWRCVFL